MKIVLPKWGLTMSDATVVRWLCAEGDTVERGDPLVEVETEKATAEVEAPESGVIAAIVANTGAVVGVGDVLALLETAGDADSLSDPTPPEPSGGDETSAEGQETATARPPDPTGDGSGEARVPASPLARRIARELGIDLARVHGTGPRGTVTEADVRAAKAEQRFPQLLTPARVIELAGMRRAIATAMTQSLAQGAQLTLTRDVEVTGALAVREAIAEGATITDVFVAAAAHALRRHPGLNAHLVEDEIRVFHIVNVGLAVALDDGLVTPVIRDAASLSLAAIASERGRLVAAARAGKLRQADIEAGTFTITNLGGHGIDAFTPILNPPEVAILGIGAIRTRASFKGGGIVPRDECTLSLTFDHRALDGAPAALFLADVAELLADAKALMEQLP